MYKDLDPLLHSQLRLTIVSHLVKQEESDFKAIKALTGANSGNISTQVNKLEQAGYLTVNKGFKGNYPHTSLSLTTKGLKAFEIYVEALRGYLEP